MSEIKGLRCLVVDDNELNRIVLRELLKLDGAVVTTLASGLEAVSEASDHASHYDVVLMDIQMPGIDGLEATRRIRERISERELPIIAVTADGAGVDANALRAAGMQGLLEKPLDSQALMRLLSKVSREH
jgi:CheY-like chemotaxis protein